MRKQVQSIMCHSVHSGSIAQPDLGPRPSLADNLRNDRAGTLPGRHQVGQDVGEGSLGHAPHSLVSGSQSHEPGGDSSRLHLAGQGAGPGPWEGDHIGGLPKPQT
jgi:hypothetical protein